MSSTVWQVGAISSGSGGEDREQQVTDAHRREPPDGSGGVERARDPAPVYAQAPAEPTETAGRGSVGSRAKSISTRVEADFHSGRSRPDPPGGSAAGHSRARTRRSGARTRQPIARPGRWNAACTLHLGSRGYVRPSRRARVRGGAADAISECRARSPVDRPLERGRERRRGHDPVRLHGQHALDPRRHHHDPAGRNHHGGLRKRDLPRHGSDADLGGPGAARGARPRRHDQPERARSGARHRRHPRAAARRARPTVS